MHEFAILKHYHLSIDYISGYFLEKLTKNYQNNSYKYLTNSK